MKNLFYVRHTCRLCHSDKQELVVPMAGMPIGTPNFQVPNASVDDPVFRAAVPMALHLCADCGHLQILHVGNRGDPVPQLRLHHLALARPAGAFRGLCQRRRQPFRHRAGLAGRRTRQQ
ncbi:hypothetical protein ACVWWR_008103 [Bradyrhizobium sp. LM3.2]